MAEHQTMRDKAIALAKHGFRVFKLRPHSKLPAVKNFPEAASHDLDVVYREWTGPDGKSTEHNIGISTRGMMVLDVDTRDGKDGEATLKKVVDLYGLDLDTITSQTPTGGRHIFYGLKDGVQVRNSCDKFGPGLDIRGHNGYVVAPGSVVPKGEYRWLIPPGARSTLSSAAKH